MERIVKENYYLDIAETVLERSTCLRRQYGAIIVRNDEIVATGYNGAPRGRKNCSDLGYCVREQMRVPRGERYELCRSVHAEANAIISASRNECIGGDIYLVGHDAKTGAILSDATSCSMCRRMIINAGLRRVVIRNTETESSAIDLPQMALTASTNCPLNFTSRISEMSISTIQKRCFTTRRHEILRIKPIQALGNSSFCAILLHSV